jgi:hypothetical protein
MIATDDVRALLDAADEDAVLVVVEGRAEVISGRALDSDQYRGALQVITREDLGARVGAQPSDHDLAEQAAQLDSTVSEMGG